MGRYDRNGILSKSEQEALWDKKICIVGCGGLGGYLIEMLARIGVGNLTVIDGDTFVDSNLNRQILATESTLERKKAYIAAERVNQINSSIYVRVVDAYLTKENALSFLENHDLIMDALDNIPARFTIQEAAQKLGNPLIHGAIAGWFGQVTTIFPGDDTLKILYPSDLNKGIEGVLGNPSFTPACIASIQVSEAIKYLTGKGDLLQKKVLYLDLLTNETQIIEL